MIRAEHQSAYALRQAGKELVRAVGGQDSSALAAMLATAVYVLIALDRWHQQRGHEQQADAAQLSLTHLQNAYQHAGRPVLTRLTERTPGRDKTQRLASAVHAAVPDHAGHILADPAWPALATTLAQAESAGIPPHRMLKAAAGQRELDSADRPAEVLIWRLRNATTDHMNARTRAATTRTRQTTTASGKPATTPATVRRPDDTTRRGR
ncbi:hypothetical protein ACLMNJ_29065 [Streptomyces seoulensis]